MMPLSRSLVDSSRVPKRSNHLEDALTAQSRPPTTRRSTAAVATDPALHSSLAHQADGQKRSTPVLSAAWAVLLTPVDVEYLCAHFGSRHACCDIPRAPLIDRLATCQRRSGSDGGGCCAGRRGSVDGAMEKDLLRRGHDPDVVRLSRRQIPFFAFPCLFLVFVRPEWKCAIANRRCGPLRIDRALLPVCPCWSRSLGR
jgi:hypothetical protein